MIQTSDAIKTAMKAPVKVIGATIADASGFRASSKDNLISVELEQAGALFNAATKQISVKLLGVSYNLQGKTLNLTLDVQVDPSKDKWESIDLGAYKVDTEERSLDAGTTTVKAYDAMGTLAKTVYAAGQLKYPCTVKELVEQIAKRFELKTDIKWDGLPTRDYRIPEDLYAKINNTTYRDILAQVAGATASIARVTGANTLQLVPVKSDVVDKLTFSNLKTFKNSPLFGAINSLVLSRMPQEDNIVLQEKIEENE